jgi:hypothetical protein
MKFIIVINLLLLQNLYAQVMADYLSIESQQIIDEKMKSVESKYQNPSTENNEISIYGTSATSHAINNGSVLKSQQMGIDIQKESSAIISSDELPDGCVDRNSLSERQKNLCAAADVLNALSIEVTNKATLFGEVAEKSFETMVDTASIPIDTNKMPAHFSYDENGLPLKDNPLYEANKSEIEKFKKIISTLEKDGSYKGLKYNNKQNTFYVDGKKYSTELLMDKSKLSKSGLAKSLTDFTYKVLGKYSKISQQKILQILKDKKLFDGKRWNLVKMESSSNQARSFEGDIIAPKVTASEPVARPVFESQIDLSSSSKEEKNLFKIYRGEPIGLSSDNIFSLISKKYREKDKTGFFK